MKNRNLLDLFIWPARKFARENTLSEQVSHVIGELAEVTKTMPVDLPTTSGREIPAEALPVFRELADLHHSLETLWRVLAGLYGEDAVWSLFVWVEEKNRTRGYYPALCRVEYSPCFQCGHCGAFPKADPAAVRDNNNEVASELLSLVGIEVDIEAVAAWTDVQVDIEAVALASAVYLRASDHDDVEVPARPEFLNAYLTQAVVK